MLQRLVPQHVCRRDTKNSYSAVCQPTITLLIVPRLLFVVVRQTIDLNRKPHRRTIEIEDVRANRVLPPESHAMKAVLA